MSPSIARVLSSAAIEYRFSQPVVIAFAGAGGKTSSLYQMAEGLELAGYSVMITTTTKMFHPKVEERPPYSVLTGSVEEILEHLRLKPKRIVVVAREYDEPSTKLIGFTLEELESLRQMGSTDFLLVEADGAQQKSIKAPAEHEPVVPDSTALFIGLLGLDSLGKVLNEEHVHRPSCFSACTAVEPGETITPSAILSLVFHDRGVFKNAPAGSKKWLILNKADNDFLKEEGLALAKKIKAINRDSSLIDRVFVTSLRHPEFFQDVSEK